MYDDIGGVVSNAVIFHRPPFLSARISATSGAKSASDPTIISFFAGMLLRLTVSGAETMIMANVALKSGSSQQGKAFRAAIA